MKDLIEALQALLPLDAVLADAADKAAFETDWRRIHNHKALAVVFPRNAEQVSQVVKLCAAAGCKIVPQGGNTGLVAGGVPVAGPPQLILSLKKMNKIRHIDVIGDTITVEAGVTLQQVQEAAAEAGKRFPVSLGAEGSAQIGGVISTNAGGVQVLSYGSMRVQVLGLEVVLADGRLLNGLRALRKDNTGFDLKQFFIGAEGCLGIITAAALRLHPAVTDRATVLVGVPALESALAVFQALRARGGNALTMCEFISGTSMELAIAHVAGNRLPFAASAYLLVEFSGQGSMQQPMEEALALLLEEGTASHAVIAQSERERADFLRIREGVSEGELAEGGAVKHDIAVPIGKIPETIRAVEALMAAQFPDCRLNIFGHIGDGNLHVNVRPPPGQTLGDIADRQAAITQAVESLAVAQGGSFSAEHGIGQMRIAGMLEHKSAVELDLMRAVKHAFDPETILNPGKMLPEG